MNKDISKRIQKVNKKNKKIEHFIRTKMWFNTWINYFKADKGQIPKDIGDNQYITQNYMSSIILVNEFSLFTPLAMTSDLIKSVKESVPEIVIDFTFKNTQFEIDPTDYGLKERVEEWKRILDSNTATTAIKERDAWLLYSYEVLKSGKMSYQTRAFITVRAKNNSILHKAIKHISSYLSEYDIDFKIIKTDIQRYLNYISPVIDKQDNSIKDVNAVISTVTSLAEILPITQGLNDETGTFLGIDRLNENPYMIDFRSTARAKNIYVLAPSGDGKTFLVITWLIDMFLDKYSISIMDVKGNEFTPFTNACNGHVVSMRPGSTSYVNTFKVRESGLDTNENPSLYFRNMLKISKTILLIIANVSNEKEARVSALIEEFLEALYLQIGVDYSNIQTWFRTEILTPFKVYEYFINYISPVIREIYSDIIVEVMLNFKAYLDPEGSNSDLFRKQYNIEEIIQTRVLCFDYGLLDKNRIIDFVTLRLKNTFAKLITDSFVRSNKDKKIHTVRVLEESQMADSFLMRMYAEEFSLRRAQNQITIMLGNSISALKGSKDADIILENVNIWCLGRQTKSNKQYLTEEYALDTFADKLDEIEKDNMDRTFLLVNKLHRDTTSALLKAFVPTSVVKGNIFKIVDVEE